MSCRYCLLVFALALLVGCGNSAPHTPTQLVNMGKYDEAIQACDAALANDPKDAKSHLYRGRAYHLRNGGDDLDRAIADFTRAIELAPRDPEAYYDRSLAYRDHGDFEKYAEDGKMARQLDSKVKEAYAMLPESETPTPSVGESASAAEKSSTPRGDAKETETPVDDGEWLRKSFDAEKANSAPSAMGKGKAKAKGDEEETDSDKDKFLPLLAKPQFRPLPEAAPDRRTPAAEEPGGEAPAAEEEEKPRPRGGKRPPSATNRQASGGEFRSTLPPGPISPFQPGGTAGPAPIASPFSQGPGRIPTQFPQHQANPTGRVEPQPLGPFAPQTRQNTPNPFSVPTVRPAEAYHDDFRP